MGIQYLCLLHQFIIAPADRIGLLIHDLIISKLHVFGGELFSIMPEDPLPEEESDHRFWTFLNLPGFGQISHKVLKISVIFNQSVEDEGVDFAGSRILSKDRIEKGGITDRADDQLVDLLWRSGANEDDIDP